MATTQEFEEDWEKFCDDFDTEDTVSVSSSITETSESDTSETEIPSKKNHKLCPQLQAKKDKLKMKRMEKKEQSRLHQEQVKKMIEEQKSSSSSDEEKPKKKSHGYSRKASKNKNARKR